jgi:hypothetical protein
METNKRKPLELLLGIFLLIPPIISVVSYILRLLGKNLPILRLHLTSGADNFNVQGIYWSMGDNASSSLPIYFGLMAIAGAILISNSIKK